MPLLVKDTLFLTQDKILFFMDLKCNITQKDEFYKDILNI
jgi:hypothetical protein